MLNFYHDLGMIIKHGSTVVLQAQWLIDIFKQLITIPRYKNMVRKYLNVFFLLEQDEIARMIMLIFFSVILQSCGQEIFA